MNRNTQQQTVTMKNLNASLSAAEQEEANHVNAAVCTGDKTPAVLGKEPRSLTQSIGTIAVSWVILSVALALDIYFTSVISENNTKLTEENQKLTRQNQKLETTLKQIQNMKWNESQSLNVSRAQWSIDAYCRIPGKNGCQACQKGWILYESSCYAFNNAGINQQRNWKEAQDDCREKISDLVVILDEKEKKYLTSQSWTNGEFWIGLRVEDGRWKWVDGRNLTENSWIKPAEEGHCAISVQGNGWRSVKCSERNQWICEKEALSV